MKQKTIKELIQEIEELHKSGVIDYSVYISLITKVRSLQE